MKNIFVGKSTASVVEAPGESQFERTFVQRIVQYGEIVPRPEQVFVQVLHLDQNSHPFPLGRDKQVDQWIVSQLLFPLVIKLRCGRIITECVILGIVPSVESYLHPQYVLHDIEFEKIAEISARQRNGYDLLYRTKLKQNPVV